MTFTRFACWNDEEIEPFVRREALQGSRAIFRGAHLPIRDFELREGQLEANSDRALLNALVGTRPHVLAFVEGEPGSGKSHLVRWLQGAWPATGGDHVVLVPRADGSLIGTLTRLRSELARPYSEPLEGIAARNELSDVGQARNLTGLLGTLCRAQSFEREQDRPPHWQWLEQEQAWRLLNHHAVVEEWPAAADVVHQLTAATEETDQELARFEPEHVAQLVNCIRRADPDAQVGFKARRLLIRLENEARAVSQVPRQGDRVAYLSALGEVAPDTVFFLAALQARLPLAVQGLLGIGRDELEQKFLEVRRLLRRDDRRLVLMLEDITNLQGVDQQLIEALLPNPEIEAHADLCELVAVLGMTPYYFRNQLEGLGNIRDRLRFHVRLTSEDQAVELARREAKFLAQPEVRERFVATYLNAVRVGRDAMESWDRSGADKRPNRCEACEFRDACHSAFGAVLVDDIVGPVGLYPHTRESIHKLYAHLVDHDHVRALRTPRGILQNIVAPALHGRRELVEGQFPPAEIENRNIDLLAPGIDVRTHVLAKINDSDRERVRRTIVWWGDRHSGRKREEHGRVVYSGVAGGVMAAFALPWPGEGLVQPPVHIDGGLSHVEPLEPPHDTARPPEPPTATTPVTKVATAATPGPLPTPVAPTLAAPEVEAEWKVRLEELGRWLDGQAPRSVGAWDQLLLPVVSAIAPETLDRTRALWDKVFTSSNVTLEGGRQDINSLRFDVPRDLQTLRGLTALVWLRHGTVDDGARSRYIGDLAAFQRWLTGLALAHFDRVQAEVRASLGADPVPLAARLLVANEWLAGRTAPDDSPLLQWQRVWSPPPGTATASDDGRGERWRKLAEKVRARIPLLRERFPELGRVGPKPNEALAGLIDGAVVFDAISDASRAPIEWPAPDTQRRLASVLRELVGDVAESGGYIREKIAGAIDEEERDVRDKAMRLDETAAGISLEHFLRSAREIIGNALRVHAHLLPPAQVQRWNEIWRQLESADLAPGTEALAGLDDTVVTWAEARSDAPTADKLSRLARVPKRQFSLVCEAVLMVDAAVDAVYREAARLIGARDPAGQERLERISGQLTSAAAKLFEAAGGGEVGNG